MADTESGQKQPPEQFPKLVAKLKELVPKLGTAADAEAVAAFGTPEYGRLMLTGVPIEQVAGSLSRRYLYEAHKAIAQLRQVQGSGWDPSEWTLVCSPWVFEHWTHIGGVPVTRTCPLPWGIFLVQSRVWSGALPAMAAAPQTHAEVFNRFVPTDPAQPDSIPLPPETS